MGAVGSLEVSIRNNPKMRTCILIILVASLLVDIASACKKDKPCYDYGMKKYDKACKCKDARYRGNMTMEAIKYPSVVVPLSRGPNPCADLKLSKYTSVADHIFLWTISMRK